ILYEIKLLYELNNKNNEIQQINYNNNNNNNNNNLNYLYRYIYLELILDIGILSIDYSYNKTYVSNNINDFIIIINAILFLKNAINIQQKYIDLNKLNNIIHTNTITNLNINDINKIW